MCIKNFNPLQISLIVSQTSFLQNRFHLTVVLTVSLTDPFSFKYAWLVGYHWRRLQVFACLLVHCLIKLSQPLAMHGILLGSLSYARPNLSIDIKTWWWNIRSEWELHHLLSFINNYNDRWSTERRHSCKSLGIRYVMGSENTWTHWGLVAQMSVMEISHHWLRSWVAACCAPSH